VLVEIAGLADQGGGQLLGKTSTPTQRQDDRQRKLADGRIADFATLLEYVSDIPASSIRYTTSHPTSSRPA
jgi:hypothetical protein